MSLGTLVWQRKETAQQRERLAAIRHAMIDIPAENMRLKAIVVTGNQTEAAQQVREEIARTRQDIAAFEQRIQQGTAAAKSPRSSPMAFGDHYTENRDPEKGPVRLEHFSNLGQATPSAAFQTLIWAIISEENDALVPLFAISPAGRAKLREILAPMSPAIKEQYSPPEKLVGMLAARDFLDEEGFEIAGTSPPDNEGRAILRVLRVRNGRKNKLEKKYPLQLGPTGWQLPITDKMIDEIHGVLESANMYIAPRTRVPARP